MNSWNAKWWKLMIGLPVTMVVLAMIINCGDYKNVKNAENTGVADFIISIDTEDNGNATVSIDVGLDICDPGPPAVLESFVDATASVSLSYDPTAACDNISELCPELYLKSFTVSWSSPDTTVTIPSKTYDIFEQINANSSVTLDLTMLDQTMKDQYAIDYVANGGSLLNQVRYFVTYTFKGETDFGNKFEAKGTTYVLLADYNYCP